ncbi:MAG: hypothetical protein HY800_00290 [Ignavibacteriales bacterium]|nr:hypothetical protein [Ignavibacteriales bacterium]
MIKSLKSGFVAAWRNKRMIFVYYLVNLLLGLMIVLPFRMIISDFVGNTLMGEKLAGRLDMDFLFEFIIKSSGGIDALKGSLLIIPLLYWLCGLFLSGGAYSIFISGERYSAAMFWGYSARYFGRFLRLFMWSIPAFIILYGFQFIEIAIVRIFWGKDPYQYITFWGTWIRGGLGYIGILIYYLILDYARIYVLSSNEHRMRKALWFGIRFTFRNFFKTFSLTFILFIIGITVLLIYNPLADALHAPSAVVVIILLLVQQLYILIKMLLRLTLYAGQSSLFKKIILSTVPSNV